jgi:hypothetical protein
MTRDLPLAETAPTDDADRGRWPGPPPEPPDRVAALRRLIESREFRRATDLG